MTGRRRESGRFGCTSVRCLLPHCPPCALRQPVATMFSPECVTLALANGCSCLCESRGAARPGPLSFYRGLESLDQDSGEQILSSPSTTLRSRSSTECTPQLELERVSRGSCTLDRPNKFQVSTESVSIPGRRFVTLSSDTHGTV